MSLLNIRNALNAEIDEKLRAGEYCPELIARLYMLDIELMKGQKLEAYIPYSDRK